MKDGLYQVTTPHLCAGFVIEGGKVIMCAPILRGKFAYWKTVVKRVKVTLEPSRELLEQIAKIIDRPGLSDREVKWTLTRPLIYAPH